MASSLECPVCELQNTSSETLYNHLLSHSIPADGSRKQVNGIEKCLDDHTLKRYNVLKHVRNLCKYCLEGFYVRHVDADEHMQKGHQATLKCPVKYCTYISKDNDHFKEHFKGHALRHRCAEPGCREWFVLEEELNLHKVERDYLCSKCSKRFHTRFQVVKHESRCGQKGLRHRCAEPGCNEWFLLEEELNLHKEEHEYLCSKCAERFHTRFQVVEHESQCGN